MRSVGQTVRPETVVEKSFMESVSGLINEVAPSSYYQSHACHHSGGDHTEPVQWARFEQCDATDYWPTDGRQAAAAGAGDALSTVSRPLLLVLGYSSGVQVWSVGGGGLAQEVLSWRQGVARDARLLPAPTGGAAGGDIYGARRPLLALCVAAGTETLFSSVSVVSLRTGEQVKSIKFQSSISGLVVSKRALVVTFVGKLAVFDARTFEDRFTVTTCYPSPGLEDNPTALGDRWLAYGERCHDVYLESRGGLCTDYSASYTASVFHAAKSITKGLRDLSEGLACKFSGGGGGSGAGAGGAHPAPAGSAVHSVGGVSGGGQLAGPGANYQGGLVTVLDVVTAGAPPATSQESADDSDGVREGGRGVLAHFQAHTLPLVQLCFDRSGSLLLTADKSGHSFHVFRVEPHPVRPALAQVTQLYALYRGDTSAKVVDMTFSGDSRWVSVATHRGTTHLFPVSPYGGPITARTHCGVRVVNKLSRFHKSAGFEDVSHCSGRVSPVLRQRHLSGVTPSVVVPPLAQLRQPILSQFTVSGSQSGGRVSGASSAGAAGGASSGDDGSHVRVVSTFAASRGWSPPCHAAAPPPPPPTSLAARDAACVDALYVFNCNSATLIEYQVQPRATALVAKDKVPQDSPIEVQVHAQARWLLARLTVWPELRPPLLPLNPLLAVCCAGGGGDSLETGATSSADTSSDCAIEHWVSQVEILTHAGPHRRLWMGPQFSFRPYSSGTPDDSSETRDLLATVQSSPLNLPAQLASLSIECGSASSVSEVCPRLVDTCDVVAPSVLTDCRAAHSPGGATGGSCSSSSALQQQLADAMADTVAAASCDDNQQQQQLLDSCFAAATVTGDGSMCETMTSLLSSPATRVRRDESPHSSTSSSSVDIRSSPDPRAPSPLDFSIYTDPPPPPDSPRQQQQQSEHMCAVRCSEQAEGPEQEEQEADDEQLAEQGWGEDIILAADPWDSASVWPSAQSCSVRAVSAPVDHPLPVSDDDDQKPTPSTKRRGKKKRK